MDGLKQTTDPTFPRPGCRKAQRLVSPSIASGLRAGPGRGSL